MTSQEIIEYTINFGVAVKEARMRHAYEIDQVEREVNSRLGGDAQIAEVIAILALRGWRPPIESKERSDV